MKMTLEASTLDVGKEVGTNGSDLDIYALLMGVSLTNPEGYAKAVERMERCEARNAPEAEKITLGDALREHLHVNRMTRVTLCTEIGISYPYLCELIKGRKHPSHTVMQQIRAAGVDTSKVAF